ncbi:MAG TPA: DUF2255 family protein [Candidatus Acidoferrales bacterium]|nr:DUF2255 family protein [Candidatus Acidoferrales bacterium]
MQRLETAKEVDIETTSAEGKAHRVPIWVVIVDDVPYVRSVRGKKGRWYQELTARPGALHAGSRRIAVKAVRVTSVETIDFVSQALWRKYEKNSSLFSMLRLATLDTTLRLEPA